jgi:hypothetical protein
MGPEGNNMRKKCWMWDSQSGDYYWYDFPAYNTV